MYTITQHGNAHVEFCGGADHGFSTGRVLECEGEYFVSRL